MSVSTLAVVEKTRQILQDGKSAGNFGDLTKRKVKAAVAEAFKMDERTFKPYKPLANDVIDHFLKEESISVDEEVVTTVLDEVTTVREWRYYLQRTLLPKSGTINAEDALKASWALEVIENYSSKITKELLASTHIGKVVNKIAGLSPDKIPDHARHRIIPRCSVLVNQWLKKAGLTRTSDQKQTSNLKPSTKAPVIGKYCMPRPSPRPRQRLQNRLRIQVLKIAARRRALSSGIPLPVPRPRLNSKPKVANLKSISPAPSLATMPPPLPKSPLKRPLPDIEPHVRLVRARWELLQSNPGLGIKGVGPSAPVISAPLPSQPLDSTRVQDIPKFVNKVDANRVSRPLPSLPVDKPLPPLDTMPPQPRQFCAPTKRQKLEPNGRG